MSRPQDHSGQSSDAYFQHDDTPCHKAQIISHRLQMGSTVTRPQPPSVLLWDTVQQIHNVDVQATNFQQLVTLSCQYGPKCLSDVSSTLFNLCCEEMRQFKGQRGTSKAYLRKGAAQ